MSMGPTNSTLSQEPPEPSQGSHGPTPRDAASQEAGVQSPMACLLPRVAPLANGGNSRPVKMQTGGSALPPRPNSDTLPKAYQQVLEQVEKSGWKAMRWANGYTLLHWGGKKGRVDVASYVLVLRADPHAEDAKGMTALDYALEAGQTGFAVTQLLLGQGALPKSQRQLGTAPGGITRPGTSQMQHRGSNSLVPSLRPGGIGGHGEPQRLHPNHLAEPHHLQQPESRQPSMAAIHTAALEEITYPQLHPRDLVQQMGPASVQSSQFPTGLAPGSAVPDAMEAGVTIPGAHGPAHAPDAGDARALKLTEEQRRGIPVSYLKTIEAIDRRGWEKMHWARGFTLLHWAGKNGRTDLVEFFLHKQADPNSQDSTGKTALDYAQQHGKASEELTRILMNAQMLAARAGAGGAGVALPPPGGSGIPFSRIQEG